MMHYQFVLPRIIEYLRVIVRRTNKQSLAAATDIPYTRLIYFARSANSVPNPADITALVRHYLPGYTFTVLAADVPVDVPVVEHNVVDAPPLDFANEVAAN